MATLIALSKILLAAVSVAGVGAASAFAIKNTLTTHLDQTPTKLSVVVVKAQATQTLQTASKLSVSGASQSFKCRLQAQSSEDALSICKLVELTIPNKWIDLTGIKQATQSTTLSLEDLKDATKQFKLEVSGELFNKLTPTSTPKIVEIVSTTSSPVVHAELTTLFKVDVNTVDYNNVSTLLGKTAGAYASIDTAKTSQCPLASGTSLSSSHTCTFKPFGSATPSPAGPGYTKVTDLDIEATDSTSLTANKYYFVNYSTPLAKSTLSSLSTVYANEADTTVAINKTTLHNVVPVIFNGSGENKKAFVLSKTPSYPIIVKKSTALQSSKSISHTNSTKNYKCKLSSDAFDCDLVDLDLSATKTSLTATAIKDFDLSTDLSLDSTESKTQYFKLNVPGTQFETIKASLASTPSTVTLVEKTDGTTKIGDLTAVFAIDDDNVPHFQKSTFLVKNAVITGSSMTENGTFDSSNTHYCSFSTTGKPDASPSKCKLIDLGSPEISPSQEITDTAATSPITTANTYLVYFIDDSGNPTTVANSTKGENNLLFLEQDMPDAAKKLIAKFNNADIQEALTVEADSSKKYLFILS